MSTIQHFLLTRLNVRIPWMATPSLDKEAEFRRFDSWLNFFEHHCVPSVIVQSSADFTWLVYINPNTPKEFLSRIDVCRERAGFTPVMIEIFDLASVNHDIRLRCTSTVDKVLTTRLDGDDAISRRHIEIVRCSAERQTCTPENPAFFNFLHGFSWYKHRVYATKCAYSPFFSVMDSIDAISTGYAYDHRNVTKSFSVEQITSEPGWMQTVHCGSYSYSGKLPRLPIVSRKKFIKYISIDEEESLDARRYFAEDLLHNLTYRITKVADKLWFVIRDPKSVLRMLAQRCRPGAPDRFR